MAKSISPFASLKFKDYSLFFWGSIASEVGSQMQVVAINWQIYEITHSAVALGLVGLVSFIPILIFSLIGGITADKHDRKQLLIWSQLFQALFALGLTIASFLNLADPILIYSAVALSFVARSFQAPARQAIIPDLVSKKHFMNAVSLNVIIRQSALLIGPAIGGFIIEGFGVKAVYLLNTVSFFLLIFALIPIKVSSTHIAKSNVTYSLKSIWEGIKFIRSNRILFSSMMLDFLATFFSSATTLLPIFAKDILGTGAKGLGLLYAAPSVGAVIAGLVIASIRHIKNQGKVILGSIIIYGAATIGFGLSNSFILSLIFLSLVGIGDMISTVLRNTIRQLLTPDHLRGRMVALNMIFVQGGPLIGEFEAGLLAAIIGAPASVALGGALTVALTILIALKNPKLRNYQGDNLAI